jgi:hypothetical protein
MNEEKTLLKINYKDYPEYMFAILAAYLPEWQGNELRQVAGEVVFRHTDKKGNTYKNGVLHSYSDLPASIDNGVHSWYRDGKLHRDGDIPAVINGSKKAWYKHGKLHRDCDLPAVIDGDNYKEWYKNGERHRDGDRPALIGTNIFEWWKNGKIHRDHDLPALIDNEYLEWWIQGERIKIVVNKYSQSYINLVVESSK